MIFGYARVSTEEQNLNMQVDALTRFGVEKIYKEKLTGTRKDRPGLEELLKRYEVEIKLLYINWTEFHVLQNIS